MHSSLAIVAAVNNDQVLAENLQRSPMVKNGDVGLIVERGYPCAGAAYNAGMAKTASDYVIFAHQDVYFPHGWEERSRAAIQILETSQTPWAVMGVWGVMGDGKLAGRVWCTGGGLEHRGLPGGPHRVDSIDEIVIVVKRAANLRFDERLPGFHLYSTDIVLEARKLGLGTFVIDNPVIHNSRINHNVYDRWYRAAYQYMQRKWHNDLPLRTCVAPLTQYGQWEIRKRWLKAEARKLLGIVKDPPRIGDPHDHSVKLGYEPAQS